ncbi:MAG: acetyl-CoA carboxylase biotin carboxylase subunit, partial [Calditrichaeota bacterium]
MNRIEATRAAIPKLLIANRGEIAVRIIRTCREMGIATVAVFSEADRAALHVQLADEAYLLGPPPASQSYLNMDRLIDIARKAGAAAIHPGYGFLAENGEFARRVRQAGLIFVAPEPETIEAMGSKTRAREMMQAAGVPVVPGTTAPIQNLDQARQVIDQMGGFPVLIKAAAGGGGKGMRVVHHADELARALEAAQNEARKAFADDTIYLEKFLDQPRHIEVQILADQHGHVVHLWERDCSIQRRHQKVVEETPSPALTPEKRAEMGAIAVQAARACQYRNAGTVEFLFDQQGNVYFLEMNTRLQVEHPITEMILGLDLVRLQLEVAAGLPLPFQQADLQARGHAIECRINAEDVFNQFAPSTGLVEFLELPDGPGVRWDGGVIAGQEVTPYYDPLLAKLIVWDGNRAAAIARMKRALQELNISGVLTTQPFCLAVLNHPAFEQGTYDTGFVASHWAEMQQELRS